MLSFFGHSILGGYTDSLERIFVREAAYARIGRYGYNCNVYGLKAVEESLSTCVYLDRKHAHPKI